jgi:UDP-N-acetylglucosamine 4-epimerase
VLTILTNGVDYVFHQSALGSICRSVAEPLTTDDMNVSTILNVLLVAREAGNEAHHVCSVIFGLR